MGEADDERVGCCHAAFCKSILSVFVCPGEEVAFTCLHIGRAVGSGLFCGNCEEFCVVVDFEFYGCIFNWFTIRVNDFDDAASYRGVVGGYVYFGEAAGAADYFFWSVVVSKSFGVHEHTTGSWCVEPSEVEYGFGFAGSEEVP